MTTPDMIYFVWMVAGALLGTLLLAWLALVLADHFRQRRRYARLRSLWDNSSFLRWFPPGMERPRVVVSPLPKLESLLSKYPLPSVSLPSSAQKRSSDFVQKDFVLAGDTHSVGTALTREPESIKYPEQVVHSPHLTEDPTPADQVLYLDPDYELSEIKRVLRIWSMVPEGDVEKGGRWIGEDGTLIQLFRSDAGYPYLEIRGPMADDLAQFLPEDLPVHPVVPSDLV